MDETRARARGVLYILIAAVQDPENRVHPPEPDGQDVPDPSVLQIPAGNIDLPDYIIARTLPYR